MKPIFIFKTNNTSFSRFWPNFCVCKLQLTLPTLNEPLKSVDWHKSLKIQIYLLLEKHSEVRNVELIRSQTATVSFQPITIIVNIKISAVQG